MSGVYPVTQMGPDTHTVSATVTGGQLVFPDSSNAGMVKPTTGTQADGATCLGMAMNDAVPAGSGSNLAFGTAPNTTSVVYGPATVMLKAGTGGVLYGQLVCAGANGTVIQGTTPTFDQIIGRCVEPAGIAAGSTGRVRLR